MTRIYIYTHTRVRIFYFSVPSLLLSLSLYLFLSLSFICVSFFFRDLVSSTFPAEIRERADKSAKIGRARLKIGTPISPRSCARFTSCACCLIKINYRVFNYTPRESDKIPFCRATAVSRSGISPFASDLYNIHFASYTMSHRRMREAERKREENGGGRYGFNIIS